MNNDINKLASQLINSNPARPRKDLITPELNKGTRKLTEGIKVNKDTLDQVEKKPRIPMAKVGKGSIHMNDHQSEMEMLFRLGFKKELEKNAGLRKTLVKGVVGFGKRLNLAKEKSLTAAKALRSKFTGGATNFKARIAEGAKKKIEAAKMLRGKLTGGATNFKARIAEGAKKRLEATRATSAAGLNRIKTDAVTKMMNSNLNRIPT